MSVTIVRNITQHGWIMVCYALIWFSNNYIFPIRDDYETYTFMSVKFPSAIDVTKTEKLNNLTQCYKVGCFQFCLSTLNRTILSPFITPTILLYWDCTVCVVGKWVHLCTHTHTHTVYFCSSLIIENSSNNIICSTHIDILHVRSSMPSMQPSILSSRIALVLCSFYDTF
jgi:hypothetical protein